MPYTIFFSLMMMIYGFLFFFFHTKTFTPIILSSSHVHYFWVVLIGNGDFVGGSGFKKKHTNHQKKAKNPEKVCRKKI